ncbi:OLC1v1019204C1 [Oldenlandia corymbosa var. corymbosa]|uniref:OLC1v1019204C1 n=1 Tax=Oldenlandia corymbosa var. corymbosa TaxID=529605 RepID=A0AAV1EDH3_OLDCO|nr:OLC1v1019204C1 [Oldenlandia corymbosa var. corymbosa]
MEAQNKQYKYGQCYDDQVTNQRAVHFHRPKKMPKKNHEEEQPTPQEFDVHYLFERTMRNDWEEVLLVYKQHPKDAATAKLIKSEETALHIAVSSYRADQPTAKQHEEHVENLVKTIREAQLQDEILKLRSKKGNTPLHLAAALGSVRLCKCIVGEDKSLISIRNKKGETPLFMAAHHGKMEAFMYLQEFYNATHDTDDHERKESVESLCRRKDGDTILHSAISGEYFELAHKIIEYFPDLVKYLNQDGFSPLHFLARKPNVFESSSNFRLLDRFIYHCMISNLKNIFMRFHLFLSILNGTYYPENYQTCVNFFALLWATFKKKLFLLVLLREVCGEGPRSSTTDEENPEKKEEANPGLFYLQLIYTLQRDGSKNTSSFPQIYATGILLFKLLVNLLLTMFGIGIWRISKIKEKKYRYKWAAKIMNELISLETDYKFFHNGGTPTIELEPMYAGRLEAFEPPLLPPPVPHSRSVVEENRSGKHKNQQDMSFTGMIEKKHETAARTKVAKKETPLLLAAKMGITEMVEEILKKYPVAIQDLDANKKNALLLAVENRQTEVYDLLLKMTLPESVLYQVDKDGNSAIHLAAKFQKHQPWRIPGAALQMQWEIKWYKHVKSTMPTQYFIQYNKKEETASEIFKKTHESLVKDGSGWIIKTSESCSLVAALIATVAFATSTTVPGGVDQVSGHPIFENQPAFLVFSIGSVVALCFSVTALVFFLAILTSRCQQKDFRYDLPRKLLFGLSSLFTSIAAILISFCAGHFFLLKDQLNNAAYPIYTAACLPITFYAFAQLPLYFDLVWSITRKVPLRSYKVFSN